MNRPFRRIGSAAAPAPSPDPDVLLTQVRTGDEHAFAQLYDLLAPTVYGLARRVLRDDAQAEEVTQEVFLEVWRKAPSYDTNRGRAKAWIVTIAHRRAVDRVRSSQADRRRDNNDAADRPTESAPVDAAVVANLESERVRRALGDLSDAQRDAITLAYFGGHTYREVAELLNIAEGTAKTRIRDGIARLRVALEVS